MHQTLKVKEERRQPETRIEFEPELVHLQHEPQELAHQQQQQQRDKQQSVELKMSAESKEISPVKQEVAPTTVVSMESATSNRCAGCREPIRDKFIFSVIDLNWHQDCVQCADCLLKLNERCHTYEGKLYCRQDYWRRFGPKCFACEQSIERNELVQIIKGNRIYHLKCFTCSECNKQLKAGEQLHLIDGKRLLCKQDFHHQIGCRSPPSSNYPPNNNSNNKSNSCFQSATNSSPHQSQQHTISATYYTLMSNQKQQKQGQVVAAGEQKVQEQTISRRAQKKIESRQQMNAGLSADEADEMDAFEDELEAEADEEAEVDADADADDAELDEEGASLDGVRSMLGFDVDSNLENEENRSVLRFTQQADGALEQAAALSAGLGQQQLLANVSRLRKVAARAESMDGGEVKRRRRRRKKLQTAGGPSEANPAGAKRLTNRNGESILNGMPPASSILAVHGSSAAAATLQHQQQQQQQHQQAGSHQQHNQMLNQPTSNHQKSVPSSAASTASNSSTSSSISLNHQNSNHGSSHHQHHHHHHHQRSQHHEQQPHKQQQQCGQRPSSGQTGGGHKPTRVRTVLNEKQLQTLRDCYAHNPRPDALMKEQLVEMTGLSSRVIRVWFQVSAVRCERMRHSNRFERSTVRRVESGKNGLFMQMLSLFVAARKFTSSERAFVRPSVSSSGCRLLFAGQSERESAAAADGR